MSGRQLAEIGLKVWGILVLLGALVSVPGAVLTAGATIAPGEQAELIRVSQNVGMINIALSASLGLFLILCGGWLARSVIPETPVLQIGGDGLQLHALGFAIVGVFTLIGGLQNAAVVTYVYTTKAAWVEAGRLEFAWAQQRDATIRAIVQVAAGLFLLLGRDGIARGWARLRKGSSLSSEDAG